MSDFKKNEAGVAREDDGRKADEDELKWWQEQEEKQKTGGRDRSGSFPATPTG